MIYISLASTQNGVRPFPKKKVVGSFGRSELTSSYEAQCELSKLVLEVEIRKKIK